MVPILRTNDFIYKQRQQQQPAAGGKKLLGQCWPA
jgi:hypothetical protein